MAHHKPLAIATFALFATAILLSAPGCQQEKRPEFMFLAERTLSDAPLGDTTEATELVLYRMKMKPVHRFEGRDEALYTVYSQQFHDFEIAVIAVDLNSTKIQVYGKRVLDRATALKIIEAIKEQLEY